MGLREFTAPPLNFSGHRRVFHAKYGVVSLHLFEVGLRVAQIGLLRLDRPLMRFGFTVSKFF